MFPKDKSARLLTTDVLKLVIGAESIQTEGFETLEEFLTHAKTYLETCGISLNTSFAVGLKFKYPETAFEEENNSYTAFGEDKELFTSELQQCFFEKLIEKFPFINMLEEPFSRKDLQSWKSASEKFKIHLGESTLHILSASVSEVSIGISIRRNGCVSALIESILAQKRGVNMCIIDASQDPFLVDVAVSLNAGLVKIESYESINRYIQIQLKLQ